MATINSSEREELLHRHNKVSKFKKNRNLMFFIRRNWRFLEPVNNSV